LSHVKHTYIDADSLHQQSDLLQLTGFHLPALQSAVRDAGGDESTYFCCLACNRGIL